MIIKINTFDNDIVDYVSDFMSNMIDNVAYFLLHTIDKEKLEKFKDVFENMPHNNLNFEYTYTYIVRRVFVESIYYKAIEDEASNMRAAARKELKRILNKALQKYLRDCSVEDVFIPTKFSISFVKMIEDKDENNEVVYFLSRSNAVIVQ